ncbi:hypothetical protein F6U93_05115 [Tamlana haliotis]|uniref:Type I restriction modification DNA specificity domain-containing protein n=1 Tax=Pseudotamlana haliotis TaxID=2614804 RepID=A0A6N6MGX9_9FLAO|nr:restriction endonuclease subunit S [Tamlana haliotis]KAB1069134.1 hypothetical protein F6U93_05115 [Tamlana haliotis]
MSSVNKIPNGWIETTLGLIMEISSGKTRPKIEGGIPIYGGNGIMGYGNKGNQEKASIIVGRVGAYCGAVYLEKKPFWLSDNALGVLNNLDSDLMFLYYKLISMKLNNHAIGGAQPLVTQTLLKELEILIPKSIEEQKVIANILTAFDDKIENLEAQNLTLEQTAQTIFKEWFGKYQVGDELPEGWRVGKIEDLLEIKYGKDHKHLKAGRVPLYGSGGIMRYVEKPLYDKDSILIPRKGTLSNLFYLSQPFWSVDTMFYSKIKRSFFGRFTFLFLKSIDLSLMDVGSAVPSLTTQVLNQIPVIIPKDEIAIKFNKIVSTFYEKSETNNFQIQTLKQTRDTLLPKLMSGQVRVKM